MNNLLSGESICLHLFQLHENSLDHLGGGKAGPALLTHSPKLSCTGALLRRAPLCTICTADYATLCIQLLFGNEVGHFLVIFKCKTAPSSKKKNVLTLARIHKAWIPGFARERRKGRWRGWETALGTPRKAEWLSQSGGKDTEHKTEGPVSNSWEMTLSSMQSVMASLKWNHNV